MGNRLFAGYPPFRSKLVTAQLSDAVLYDPGFGLQWYVARHGAVLVIGFAGHDAAYILPYQRKGRATRTQARRALTGMVKYRGLEVFTQKQLKGRYFHPDLFVVAS